VATLTLSPAGDVLAAICFPTSAGLVPSVSVAAPTGGQGDQARISGTFGLPAGGHPPPGFRC